MSLRPVFIIGSGRSGTHWLSGALAAHPDVHATIEVQPMFGLSTQMALNSSLEQSLMPSLIAAYQKQLLSSAPRLYVDKSHPNIWIAEKLKKAFPNALFLGIERNPYATVSSMLKHQGVLTWHRRWREYPTPNRFLGITEALVEEYAHLSLVEQCALRWLSHHERLCHLQGVLGADLLCVSYERFALCTNDILGQLQQFLSLMDGSIPAVTVNHASLYKWEEQLSARELQQIGQIVGGAMK